MKRVFGVGALTMMSAVVHGACGGSDGSEILAPAPSPTTTSSGGSSGAASSASGGASSTSSSSSSSGSIADSGTDAKFVSDAEAGADADAGATCPGSVPTTADLEKDPGWQPAKAPAPVCTANEILQFEKNLKDTNIKTWKDLATGLGAACAGCIVTSSAEKNWGPVVWTAASGGDEGFANFGACFGHVSTEACGKALQFSEFCLDAACDACPTPSKQDQCVSTAAGTSGVCGPFFTKVQAECTNLASATKVCGSIANAARTLCGPNADAGM